MRPNIIFILADDMGVGEIAHAGGKVATPHLDRLAKEGLRFTDAHTTSSVCTPTRYSLLTGRYNWRSPLKSEVLWGPSPPLISTNRLTIARFLQQEGYSTVVIGKWHLGLDWKRFENPPAIAREKSKEPAWDIDYTQKAAGGPLALGFDRGFIIPASLDMPPYVYLRNDQPVGVPTVTKFFLVPKVPGPATADFDAENCLRDFVSEARAYIATVAKEKKPFFLYLPLTSPHTPIIPSEKWRGKSALGPYGNFLMETDGVVGEILAELVTQHVDANTLIFFAADNGTSPQADIPALEAHGHHPSGSFRGHKADIFEGGHRVPFIVRWRGHVPANRVCSQTVSTVDVFATIADVLGASSKIPANAAEDSFSLLPLLRDPDRASPVRPFLIHHSINGSFAIRRGEWKLTLCRDSGGWSEPRPLGANAKADAKEKAAALPAVQLYNLSTDEGERNNLEAKHPDTCEELVTLLATAIRKGRTTPGPDVANEGWPNTFPIDVLTKFPALGQN